MRRWLRRPDCPEVIRQFKYLFDKAFSPDANKETSQKHQSANCEVAHYIHNNLRYSRASTHLGNSLVVYYLSKTCPSPTVGSIQTIYAADDGSAHCLIQRQAPLQSAVHNPFLRYPFFPAMLYSSDAIIDSLDKVYFPDIVGHASRFDLSGGRSVFVNMSRE